MRGEFREFINRPSYKCFLILHCFQLFGCFGSFNIDCTVIFSLAFYGHRHYTDVYTVHVCMPVFACYT